MLQHGWYKLASLCNLEVLKQSKQSSCFARCADFQRPTCCPVQALFRFLRAVKGSGPSGCFGSPVCSSRCQEMSGDVRSYETVVMIWNVDETIIGKILILIGTYDSIIWRIYLVTDKSTCVGKETCQATLSEQWRICPWHKVQKLWSNNGTRTDDDNCHQESRWWADDQKAFNYSYSLYLLHFHHIAGRQKGSWFLPLLLLRLLSLLFLLLVKLYDTFCFRKDWKLQRVRSTWLTMCGQMVVLGA